MVRRRLLLLLVVALVAGFPGLVPASSGAPVAASTSPGTSGTPRPKASPTPFPKGSRARQLQDVLDARAAAVRSRDRTAFLRTVDHDDELFVGTQEAWFDRLAPVPLAEYRLDLGGEHTELTRSDDRKRYDAEVVVAPVEEHLRFEGYGKAPLNGTLFLTFVRRQSRWLVASDTDVEDLGLVSSRHPWDYGPVSVQRSEHFLLLMHPDGDRYSAPFLAQAERALPAVGRVWADPWDPHLPVEMPSSPEELWGYLGGGIDVSKFVAFALSSYDPERDWQWDGARVVVNRENFLAQPSAVRTSILAHELTHIASQSVRGPFILTFVEEGIADLAAGKAGGPGLTRQIRTGRFNRRLPEDFEFVSGTQEDIVASYEKASSALDFMRSRYGVDGIGGFFRAYGSVKLAPGTARYHVDQAFRSSFGLSLDDFEREWAQRVAPKR